MERTSRIAQLYGYTVCLVSLVTILFTVPSMVDSDRADTTTAGRPSDDELRKQYEALRTARIEENGFQARRSLGREFLLLVLAGGLFLGHWRWLGRRGEDPTAAV